ncbi:recombinase family protein [Methylomagnum sp.]
MRCAVYTRKSSEEGLEQAFNSLDAQREACEAYIVSQRHEGWQLVATRYDDGGCSGGDMHRPGLQALLADIRAGQVDAVVVYKIDRLTRSLADFSRMAEEFDRSGTSFVAVTQAFNTATSMGRLMLNVLLSFAQFEREITSERIRDKLAASKAKGMWMGGHVPFGYDRVDNKLVINPVEAPVVRELYRRFLEIGDLQSLVHECARHAIYKRHRGKAADGHPGSLTPFQRADLYKLLTQPLYIGLIRHHDTLYRGMHEPLISEATFKSAAALMKRLHVQWRERRPLPPPFLLEGLLHTPAGQAFVMEQVKHHPGRARFYRFPDTGGEATRASERSTNRAVVDTLCAFLLGLQFTTPRTARAREEIERLAAVLRTGAPETVKQALQDVVSAVYLDETNLSIHVRASGTHGLLAADKEITVRARLKGARHYLSVGAEGARRKPHAGMIRLLGNASRWLDDVVSGRVTSLSAISRREGLSLSRVSNIMELAFLAPDLKTAIIHGEHPIGLTSSVLENACPLPLSWEAQRRLLHFRP